jgi:deazaflavin-dependent oxidoreductase (nitroreductase family)
MTESDRSPRYVAPGGFTNKVFNPFIAWLTRRGLSVAGSRELRVVGRSSGQVRTTPVNPLDLDGTRYLVAPRGNAQWVRNLRAAGEGTLVVGRREEAFRAVEVADADKTPILREYLRRWGWEVGAFFEDLSKDSDDDALAAAAPGFPVFEVHL